MTDLRLIGEAMERYCSAKHPDDKFCPWVNNINDRTFDPENGVDVLVENLSGDELVMECEKNGTSLSCTIGRKPHFLFGGSSLLFGCTADSSAGNDHYTVPDDTVSFDVPDDITEEMFVANDHHTAPDDTISLDIPDVAKDDAELQQADVSSQKKERVIVATTDYSKGSVFLFDEGFPLSAKKILDENAVGGDICLRGFGNTFAVIDRFGGDKIQLFAGDSGFPLVNSLSTGTGSNPQDALLSGGALYASAYSTIDGNGDPITVNNEPIGDILVFDPATGSLTSNISLGQYSTNGQPNPATLISAAGDVYTIMQDLQGFTPNTNGKLIVISPTTNKVTAKIDLDCYNPYDMVYSEDLGLIFIACAGNFMATDETNAGIEAVDIASKKSLGLILTEETIGNNATKVRIVSENLGAVATSNFNATDISFITLFDPMTGAVIDENFYGTGSSNISDILIDGAHMLWIADRDSTQAGVVCIDPNNGQTLGTMTTFENPPISLATIELTER